jgi:hypothetical protein
LVRFGVSSFCIAFINRCALQQGERAFLPYTTIPEKGLNESDTSLQRPYPSLAISAAWPILRKMPLPEASFAGG